MIILGHIRVCQSKTKSCSHFRQLSITFFLSRGEPENWRHAQLFLMQPSHKDTFLPVWPNGEIFSHFSSRNEGGCQLSKFWLFPILWYLIQDILFWVVTRGFILWWGAAEVRPKKPPLFGRWFNNLSPVKPVTEPLQRYSPKLDPC